MANSFIIFEGQQGDKGDKGVAGVSSDDVNATSVDDPMFDGFRVSQLNKNITWNRSTAGTVVDKYDRLVTIAINETREAAGGFLIETSGGNLSPYSEDLLGASWGIVGGIVSAYAGEDPQGNTNSNIKIGFLSQNVVLDNTVTVTEGLTYTISFWLQNTAGTLNSASCSVGNGVSSNILNIPTDELTRVSAKCIAGSNQDIKITLTSINQTAIPLVFGVQVNDNELSSYTPTVATAESRSSDNVSLSYNGNFPLPSGDWSFRFSRSNTAITAANSYLFHNGLTGTDEFSARFLSGSFIIKNGSDEFIFAFNGVDYMITSNQTTITLYADGNEHSSFNVVSPSTAVGVTMYLGSDLNELNQLNSPLSNFRWWNEALSSDDARYIEDN